MWFEFENWAVIALVGIQRATRVSSIAQWKPTVTENSAAATLVRRCVVDFSTNPVPNHAETAL
jgi:hypothetical protein